MTNEPIIFDEDTCAESIFNKLIGKGIAVRVEDIRLIMELEYEYGVSIGIYPENGEDIEQEPADNQVLITISKDSMNSEVDPEQTLKLLQEAIESIKSMN